MDLWSITLRDKQTDAWQVDIKISDHPVLILDTGEKEFDVEFENRSDYMAARDSSVPVKVAYYFDDRKKCIIGEAVKYH